jgi:glyoxylase-like metal-dependent hydrolase (beta-lactamase superfamily II)
MPDDMILYPGHGPETTIGAEKKFNPFLAPIVAGG